MSSSHSRGGIAALILLSLIWGYTWVAMKEAVRFADPFDFSAIRAMAGSLLMFGATLWLKKPLRLQASRPVTTANEIRICHAEPTQNKPSAQGNRAQSGTG